MSPSGVEFREARRSGTEIMPAGADAGAAADAAVHAGAATNRGGSSGTPVLPAFGCAALLAGGASRRMGGGDKAGLDIGGRRLSDLALAGILERFGDVVVVTGKPGEYRSAGVRTIPDRIPGFGPLSGLHSALAASTSGWLYLGACDMPRFSPGWAAHLQARIVAAESAGEAPLACLSSFGTHIEPFHAFWSVGVLPRLERLLEESRESGARPSFHDLLRHVSHILVPEEETRRHSPDWSLFFNINRPADLEAFLRSADGFSGRRGV